MSDKYKILSKYIKDLSSETPNVESFLYTKSNISKYELDVITKSLILKSVEFKIFTFDEPLEYIAAPFDEYDEELDSIEFSLIIKLINTT